MRKTLFTASAVLALCLAGAGVAYAGDNSHTSNSSSGGSCTTNSCGDTIVECPQGTPPLLQVDARRLLKVRVGGSGADSCYGAGYRPATVVRGGSACDSTCTGATAPRRTVYTAPAGDCANPLVSAVVWLRGLHL